jgi:molecular chaperone DnaK
MIVGIDLGTSTSAIGYFSEVKGKPFGTVNLVQGGFGINWIPSAVLWDHVAGTWHVGPTARHMRMGPGRAPYYVVSAKRHLGITPNIPLNGSTTVIEDGREIEVTPQLLLSRVLRNLKDRTEELSPDFHLDKVVVAIPMVYMSHEASLTREAVEMAGLELLDFIQEPTAAALCYVHDNVDMNTLREGERILVFDLGGGTFDITVFQLVEGGRAGAGCAGHRGRAQPGRRRCGRGTRPVSPGAGHGPAGHDARSHAGGPEGPGGKRRQGTVEQCGLRDGLYLFLL